MVTGKKTINKLWNASKFSLMHLADYKGEYSELEVMDKWLLTKLQNLIQKTTEAFENYEYSKAKQEAEIFFWQVFCDNYLEIVKDRLYNPGNYSENAKKSAQYSLYESIINILKIMAPFLPHITEEIYQLYFSKIEKKKSIHIADWPIFNKKLIDEKSEKTGDLAVEIISQVRKFKSEKSLSLKQDISIIKIICTEEERKMLELIISDLKSVTRAKDVEFGEKRPGNNEKIEILISL
jgi:valyl-tRNA synthetase